MAGRDVVEAQVLRLGDADFTVRTNAAKTLGRIGPVAAPLAAEPLAQLLGDAEVPVRMQVARALGKMGDAAAAPYVIGPLTECLEDPEAVVRAAAAGTLGWMAEGAALSPRALEALARRFHDSDARVRVAAAGAFGRMRSDAVCDVAEALAIALGDDDQAVQVAAAGALVRHRKMAVEAIVRRLQSKDAQVRRRAAKALGCMGEMVAPLAAGPLKLCLEDPSAGVRVEAMSALSSICRQEADSLGEQGLKLKLPARAVVRMEDSVTQQQHQPPRTMEATEAAGADAARKKRTLSWAGGIEDHRVETRANSRLPVLLGTPTPKTNEKPDFCLPPPATDDKTSAAFAGVALNHTALLERTR